MSFRNPRKKKAGKHNKPPNMNKRLTLRHAKIRTKIFVSLMFLVILLGAIAYFSNLVIQQRSVDAMARLDIERDEEEFNSLEQQDANMLSATLEALVEDDRFKELYLEKDRDALFKLGQPLFKDLKRKYGITHWYFIQPDGSCFLRMHNKEICGDKITRATFKKAKTTQKTTAGIELGKTAFALRAVTPYYNNGELIGYVELGEEIDHFLNILKEHSGDDLVIIAEKQKLDKKDWESVRKVAGLRNNWDDLEDFVIISSTVDGKKVRNWLSEDFIRQIEDDKSVFRDVDNDKKSLKVGGFPLVNADGRIAGAVISFRDVSVHTEMAKRSGYFALVLAMILFGLMFILSIHVSRTVSIPIIKLNQVANQIAEGDLSKRIKVDSRDEVGQLSESFNKMTKELQASYEDLEKKVEQKTKELSDALEETEVQKEDLEAQTAELESQKAELEDTKKAMLNILEDLQLAKEELEEKNERLEELDRMKSDFISMVSHELRTPLTSIREGVALVQDGVAGEVNEKQEHFLALAKRNIDRLARLINDLLDISHIESGKMEMKRGLIDMREVIKGVAETFRPQIKEKGLELKAECPSGSCKLYADRDKMEQVFSNLLNNAIKFTDQGSITISGSDKGNCLEISVADTGRGIPKEDLEDVFDKFKQIGRKTGPGSAGTGLGLAICKGIIEAHGGRIWVESEPDKGSRFIFSLPKGLREGDACPNPDKEKEERGKNRKKKKEKKNKEEMEKVA